jgi:hypothetical protein
MRHARRWGRRGDIAAVLIGVGLLTTVFFGKRRAKLPPAKQVTVIRMDIARTAKIVEKAYTDGLMDEPVYTGARTQVLAAKSVYNRLLANFNRYGSIARSDRLQVAALLASAVRTVRDEVRRKQAERRKSGGS